ncbi:MAG: ATP-binding protein [Acidobacteria bacterium]|nr:ATP-binding protein [Acidobacteriota bacterium]
MTPHSQIPLVSTIGERCRVCYQCVRECPAKAIRIADHKAQVLPERCIGCGVCVKVCTQDAKTVLSAVEAVEELLAGPTPVAAILAPSFPAEFIRYDYMAVVGGLRELGFASVHEVAFGAELVAMQYRRLVAADSGKLWIATTCPAVVGYVRRYAPDLVGALAPIVSPMIAMARLLRAQHDGPLNVVFVGPCIAKKREAVSADVAGEVDEALTFAEFRRLLAAHEVDLDTAVPSEFDPPHARGGGLFPISGGMLQVAGIQEDLVTGHVMVGEGPAEFAQAIKEAETGIMETHLLELLFCKGCTMGPGMSSDLPHFGRRARVSQFVRRRIASVDAGQWTEHHRRWSDLDLARAYSPQDLRLPVPSPEELGRILGRLGKSDPRMELNCGACGYSSCRDLASAIYVGLAEPAMCLPFSIEQLRSTVRELAHSNEELADAQEALVRSEKLASMGQLAAGIAHEVNNPLGVVIMYAHFLMEQLGDRAEFKDDLSMVVEQADRCKKIVAGLLDFARQNKVEHEHIHIVDLVQKAMRSVPPPVNVTLEVESDMADPMVEADPDQLTQVLINLVTNAYAAMPDGGTLRVATHDDGDRFALVVSDSGVGIPPEHFPKLFEPFFTTKKGGKGTGLGLAVTYGIVKMHRGDITVTSNTDPAKGPTGTTFTVSLPRRRDTAASDTLGSRLGLSGRAETGMAT